MTLESGPCLARADLIGRDPKVSQIWPSKMRSGIVHHKSDRKSCVIPTADRNNYETQRCLWCTHFNNPVYIECSGWSSGGQRGHGKCGTFFPDSWGTLMSRGTFLPRFGGHLVQNLGHFAPLAPHWITPWSSRSSLPFKSKQAWQWASESGVPPSAKIKTLIDRIRAIIHIRPLITDAQTNTINW